MLILDLVNMDLLLSLQASGQLGLTIFAYGMVCLDFTLLVLNFALVSSSVSLRSFARLEPLLFAYGCN